MTYLLVCRCLGYHKVKGGYKEKDLMKKVEDEPVLAFPDHQVWSLLQFKVIPNKILFCLDEPECLYWM